MRVMTAENPAPSVTAGFLALFAHRASFGVSLLVHAAAIALAVFIATRPYVQSAVSLFPDALKFSFSIPVGSSSSNHCRRKCTGA